MHLKFQPITLGMLAASILSGSEVAGQNATPDATTSKGGDEWAHPMTPWGDPDLQGMWPNKLYSVPLVRPPQYGERLYFTEEELAAQAAQVQGRNSLYESEDDANRIGLGHWVDDVDVPPQTSLIVDPPDGSFPELTDIGEQMSAKMGSSWDREYWDKPTDFDTWDRCITRGLPNSMFPHPYNNGIQIVQAPGYVVIYLELIHEARIIPLGDMPKLDGAIEQWMGDSRAHWESNTLVVETTNFNGQTSMGSPTVFGSPAINRATSTDLHLLERFQLIGENTLKYTVTVTDPVTQTRPWTASFPLERDGGYQYFEYACHEDNEAIRGFIVNSRVLREERAAGKDVKVQSWQENLREREEGVGLAEEQ